MSDQAATAAGAKLEPRRPEDRPSPSRFAKVQLVATASLALAMLMLGAGLVVLTAELSRWRAELPAVLAQSADWQRQSADWQHQSADWRHQSADWRHQSADWRHQLSGVRRQVEKLQPKLDRGLQVSDRAVEAMQEAVVEVKQVNSEIPAIVKEAHSLIDQADDVAKDSKSAGKQASEGAVKGFVTGVLKLPFDPFTKIHDDIESRRSARHKHDSSVSAKEFGEELNAKDQRMVREATYSALNSGKEGIVYPWNNPDSKSSGTVTVKREYERSGEPCRDVAYELQIKDDKEDKSKLSVCRKDRTWHVVEGHRQ